MEAADAAAHRHGAPRSIRGRSSSLQAAAHRCATALRAGLDPGDLGGPWRPEARGPGQDLPPPAHGTPLRPAVRYGDHGKGHLPAALQRPIEPAVLNGHNGRLEAGVKRVERWQQPSSRGARRTGRGSHSAPRTGRIRFTVTSCWRFGESGAAAALSARAIAGWRPGTARRRRSLAVDGNPGASGGRDRFDRPPGAGCFGHNAAGLRPARKGTFDPLQAWCPTGGLVP